MSEMIDIKIRKFLYDLATKYVKEYPMFYEHEREFIETAMRNEIIKLRTIGGT